MNNIKSWNTPVVDRTAEDVEYAKAHKYSSDNFLYPQDSVYPQFDLYPNSYRLNKGALNTEDLERVGGNLCYLFWLLGIDDRISQITPSETLYPGNDIEPGMVIINGTGETDILYNPPEIPMVKEYYDVLEKWLRVLISKDYKYSTTPKLPSRPYNTYIKWNEIEQIINDAKEVYNANISMYNYAGNGELYAGDSLLI